MKITLREIAEKSGLSVSMLSRVANGHGYVSAEMRSQVEDVLHQYGYERSVPKQHNDHAFDNVIMVITGSTGNVYQPLIESLCKEAEKRNRRILVAPTNYESVSEKEYMRFAQRVNLYGLILVSIADKTETANILQELRFPVVLNGRALSSVLTDAVTQDNYGMGRIAAQLLLDAGHKKIAYLGGPKDSSITKGKENGFSYALEKNNLILERRYVSYGHLDIESGKEYGHQLLSMDDPPTAVFCSNDLMAIGIAEAFKEQGLKIPKDLSLIACDRTQISDLYSPKITRLYANWSESAKIAFNMLEKRKNNPRLPYMQYTFETLYSLGETVISPSST